MPINSNMKIIGLLFLLFSAGCLSSTERAGQVAPAVEAARSDALKALETGEALDRFAEFIKSYAKGQTLESAEFFDQTMIGRNEFISILNDSKVMQKKIWIREFDKRIELLGDSAVVSLAWEKHYKTPAGSDIKKVGKSRFFLQKNNSQWKLVGQTGDNLFLP